MTNLVIRPDWSRDYFDLAKLFLRDYLGQMISHSDIVTQIGIDALANATGIEPVGVYRWLRRNRIPCEHWLATVRLARKKRLSGITLEAMAIWAARHHAE
jgi:hypothetical protein